VKGKGQAAKGNGGQQPTAATCRGLRQADMCDGILASGQAGDRFGFVESCSVKAEMLQEGRK